MSANKPVVASSVTDSTIRSVVYSPVVVEYGSLQPPGANENLTFTVAAEAGQPFVY